MRVTAFPLALACALGAQACYTTRVASPSPPATSREVHRPPEPERTHRAWFIGPAALPASGEAADCPDGLAEVRTEVGLLDAALAAGLFALGNGIGAALCDREDVARCALASGVGLAAALTSRTVTYRCR